MLDWLFTPQCVACGIPASTLCEPCAHSLLELGEACRLCAEPGVSPCARCSATPLPLERVLSPWRFGGQLASAIRRLKFGRRAHVARDVAPLWAPLLAAVVTANDALVVPVPLHWRRRFVRGFDHTWLLARHACASAGLSPPRPLLRRVRATPPQSTLSAEQRRENVAHAFVARDRAAIVGRAVALVDDVVTTGSTLAAAAEALRGAGATTVIGVSLARAASTTSSRG
ncbi:MAG: ComF family protein [Kofleriaceae bacterium]|nr:ComF family protein [Kofleriaceae bacterium]